MCPTRAAMSCATCPCRTDRPALFVGAEPHRGAHRPGRLGDGDDHPDDQHAARQARGARHVRPGSVQRQSLLAGRPPAGSCRSRSASARLAAPLRVTRGGVAHPSRRSRAAPEAPVARVDRERASVSGGARLGIADHAPRICRERSEPERASRRWRRRSDRRHARPLAASEPRSTRVGEERRGVSVAKTGTVTARGEVASAPSTRAPRRLRRAGRPAP